MRALSIRQPWAYLIAIGAKTIENRSWHTPIQGPLIICAGKELAPLDQREDARQRAEVYGIEIPDDVGPDASRVCARTGVIAAVTMLTGCAIYRPNSSTGIWHDDQGHHLELGATIPASTAVPVKGALGFFQVEEALLDRALGLV